MKIQQTNWRIKIKTSKMKWGHELDKNEHKTKSSQHSGNYTCPVVSQNEQNTPLEESVPAL